MEKLFNIMCCFICVIALGAHAEVTGIEKDNSTKKIPVERADFANAVKDYNAKKFPEAMQQFQRTAALGHKSSQLNIGVMYFRGEGVEKNLVDAYAWTALSAEDNNADSIRTRDIIFAKLNEQQKAQAEIKLKELMSTYSNQILRSTLYPVHSDTRPVLVYGYLKMASDVPDSIMSRKIAKYELEYDIDPKGYIHNFSFLETEGVKDPEKLINYLASSKNHAQRLDGKPIWVYNTNYKFMRSGNGRGNQLIDAINEDIRENFTAELDWSNAENIYQHAMAINYAEKTDKLKQYKTLLLLHAAQMGHPKAITSIALDTLYGNHFEQDRKKGLLWLLAAAGSKDNSALYLAASLLYDGELVDSDKTKAIQLLQQAADQQHVKSKMKLAWILATEKNNDFYNPQKALLLVKEIYTDYLDHVTAYETFAAALAANGQFDEAISVQNSAVTFAKNIDANMEQVQARLAAYKQHQAWRE